MASEGVKTKKVKKQQSTVDRLNIFIPHMTWWWRQIHDYREGNKREAEQNRQLYLLLFQVIYICLITKMWNVARIRANVFSRLTFLKAFSFLFFFSFFFSWHTTDSCDSSSLTCVCVWLFFFFFFFQCRWRLYLL